MSIITKSIIVFLLGVISTQRSYSQDLMVEQVVELQFGEDRGQAFGNLFEWVNDAGEVVGGAGFLDVYNTRFRNDRYKVQFYVRPAQRIKPTISRHPIPARHTGLFIFDTNNTITPIV